MDHMPQNKALVAMIVTRAKQQNAAGASHILPQTAIAPHATGPWQMLPPLSPADAFPGQMSLHVPPAIQGLLVSAPGPHYTGTRTDMETCTVQPVTGVRMQ